MEILGQIDLEVIKIEAGRHCAAHQRPAAQGSCRLYDARWHDGLRKFADQDAGPKRGHLVSILAKKMKLERRTRIVMPLFIGLDYVPRTVGVLGQEEVERGSCGARACARLNLLGGSEDLAVKAALRMRLKAQRLDHLRGFWTHRHRK